MSFKRTHFFIFALLLLTLVSCRKEEDTIAIITVVDITNIPQAGFFVRMYGEGSDNNQGEVQEIAIDRDIITDGNGQAKFDFTDEYELGQAGFAVLNVSVTFNDTIYEGVLKVEPEEITEARIIVN
ncbi:MAG: hypothetical protein ACI8XB_001621 [Patiriisocius sp.]|jgi:hypothetical protein